MAERRPPAPKPSTAQKPPVAQAMPPVPSVQQEQDPIQQE